MQSRVLGLPTIALKTSMVGAEAIAVGRVFHSRITEGKNEYLWALIWLFGRWNLSECPLVCVSATIR